MKEILLTSSALILVMLLLRQAFRNRISRRVQYALWLLVLARLLVPVSLPGVDFSLLTAAQPVTRQLEAGYSLYFAPVRETITGPEGGDILANTPSPNVPVAVGQSSPDNTQAFTDDQQVLHQVEYRRQLDLSALLRRIWYAGMAGMAAWLLISNLRFWRRLCKARIPYSAEGCKRPVYLVETGLPSPCLFGLVRPAVYLTPPAAETPQRLRHVLAHECAHARHLDPLWALLRSGCLAVWWFNPLVWLAAAASKADGELACDEAALEALGTAERVPYGQTLLALIPVRRDPGEVLLSATTMTAGKRQLKERITRIAENRQTRAAALFLALALAALACAVTFTGAKDGGAAADVPEDAVPLTGDELAYFNETFFNNDTVGSTVGLNIHNQFLTSLYERPEDIDLYELFYCGTGLSETMTEAERQLTGSFDANGELICPTDKLSVDAINAVLLENTGLHLEETAQTGMEHFRYLPEYTAYYHSHGDTNYFYGVQITAGERQGDTIRLYYPDSSARYRDYCDWLCVTLEAQSDGSFWFVSNQPAEKPAVPTVYPEGDPALTISLADLPAYEPAPVPVERRSGDCAEQGGGMLVNAADGSQVHVRPYLSTNGSTYLALIYDSAVGNGQTITWDAGCFFTFPKSGLPNGVDSVSLDFFSDLFGHDGLTVSYSSPGYPTAVHDYYYFEDEDTPVLLARAVGSEAAVTDLNGDGANELLTDYNRLFFQREGRLYEADITQLLEDNWPELSWWDYSFIDTSRRCLTITGFARAEGVPADAPETFSFLRLCYFDGERLLFYPEASDYTGHVADGIDAPAYVLDAARTRAQEILARRQADAPAQWDDWRITALSRTELGEPYTSLGLEVYAFGFELHAAAPEQVLLAGGMYVREDGWSGGMNDSPFLVFLKEEAEEDPVLLDTALPHDLAADMAVPGFSAAVAQMALDNRLLTPSQLEPETVLNLFCVNGIAFLNSLAGWPEAEQASAVEALASFHNQGRFTQEQDLRHTIQNVLWSQGSLTAGGGAVWRALLERTGISPGGIGGSYASLDEAILNAILDHRRSASAHRDDFYAAVYDVLDTRASGNACTVYLDIRFGSYDRTEDGYALQTGGEDPAALSFAVFGGLYQLTEYWTPLGGAYYASDLRAVFPEEAAEKVLSGEGSADLAARLARAGEEAYAALEQTAP